MQVDACIEHFKETDSATLTDYRSISRKQLRYTVIGLVVHAAEHSVKHLKLLMVTVIILHAAQK